MYAVFIGRAVQTVLPPANINIQLADGTAAAPSLNFANDTNTGIFRPTTDEIALTEGGVEGMRLNASGNVQFAKNISIGGATPATSGFGITFPGTQSASTDANTLDDYEEGTYTVTITDSAAIVTITLNSSFNELSYTKIGRVVYIQGVLVVSSISGVWTTGATTISLPFTSGNLPDLSGRTIINVGTYQVDFTAGTAPYFNVGESATTAALVTSEDNGNGGVGQIGSSGQLYINGFYFV